MIAVHRPPDVPPVSIRAPDTKRWSAPWAKGRRRLLVLNIDVASDRSDEHGFTIDESLDNHRACPLPTHRIPVNNLARDPAELRIRHGGSAVHDAAIEG